MRHKRPIAWQDINGRRTFVPAWFRLDGNTIRFALAPYNRRHPLTIDPILKFATVLSTAVTALASDSAGNTFLAGSPTVSAADTDAVVLKLDPTGKLIYRTVIGGFGTDTTSGIAVDAQGNLFVTGHSESPNFPISGAPCSALQSDAFLSKLSTTGILLASRCYGGLGVERTVGIGLDNAGAPYIAGTTTSQDLPTTSPTVQGQKLVPTSNSGFLAKFDPSNLALVYGTYLGNHATITVNSLAIDPTGAAIVAGTSSPQGFRVTPGAYNTTAPSSSVVLAPFVLKVNPAGTALVYSTWLPATTGVSSSAVAAGADESGQAIVAYPASFPGSSFPLQIVKLNAQGTGAVLEKPVYYFSQPGPMHIDRLGNILLGGQSTDINSITPTNDSLQGRPSLHAVVKLSPDLSSVQHVGLVNGQVTAVASGPSNDILVAYNDSFNAASPASPVTPGAYSEDPRFVPPFAVYRLTQGSTCSPALAPSTNFTLPTTGGSGTLQVVAPDNCTWIATTSNTFGFQFTAARSGTGNGSIPFTFPPVFGSEPGRVFTVRLSATVSYEFTQGQPPSCQASLGSISPIPVLPGGGRTSFSTTFPEGCPWTVASNAPWATLFTPASGKGSSTVVLDVQPNTGAARTTTVSVNDQNIILNQSACEYTISQSLLWNASAQTTFLNVTTSPGCAWTISSNATWLQIGIPSTALMTGPASVPVTIEQNTTSSLRAATVTAGGRTFSFTQSSSDCSLTASSPCLNQRFLTRRLDSCSNEFDSIGD